MVKEQIFGLQVSVHDAELMEVLDTTDDLLKEFARLSFFQLLLLNNVVEELTSTDELHD